MNTKYIDHNWFKAAKDIDETLGDVLRRKGRVEVELCDWNADSRQLNLQLIYHVENIHSVHYVVRGSKYFPGIKSYSEGPGICMIDENQSIDYAFLIFDDARVCITGRSAKLVYSGTECVYRACCSWIRDTTVEDMEVFLPKVGFVLQAYGVTEEFMSILNKCECRVKLMILFFQLFFGVNDFVYDKVDTTIVEGVHQYDDMFKELYMRLGN